MALISLFSAKGAPGVTSTAMLVAALWPRPTLLVDADANGGDVALRLTAPNGSALTRTPGLLTLLPLARHGLAPGVVLDHAQVSLGGQQVLVGVDNPEQAGAGVALWPVLAKAFRDLPGIDVVVDAGQLSSRSGHLALVQRSDLVLGVVRAEPSSVVHMRRRAAQLAESFQALGAEGPAPMLGMVCVESVQGQAEASSAVGTIAAEIGSVHDFGQVALDAKAVRMFHGEPVFRPERTMLVRSGRSLVQRLTAAIAPALVGPDAGSAAEVPNDAATDPATDPATDEASDGPAHQPPAGNSPAGEPVNVGGPAAGQVSDAQTPPDQPEPRKRRFRR